MKIADIIVKMHRGSKQSLVPLNISSCVFGKELLSIYILLKYGILKEGRSVFIVAQKIGF